MKKILAIMVLMNMLAVSQAAEARQFRERREIATPLKAEKFENAEDGSTKIATPLKLDDQLVRSAILSLFNNWGTMDISKYLGTKFPNREQLLNAFDRHLPFDARLEVKSIRSIRTLSQREKDGNITSLIAADVETEVVYQDPTLGLQRLNGTGEYVFELVTRSS